MQQTIHLTEEEKGKNLISFYDLLVGKLGYSKIHVLCERSSMA